MDRDPRFQVRQFPTHETKYGLRTFFVYASIATTVLLPTIVYVALRSQENAGFIPLVVAVVCFLSGLASMVMSVLSGVWISERGLRTRILVARQAIEWQDVRSFGITQSGTVVLERENGAPFRLPLKLYSNSGALRAELVRRLGEPKAVTSPNGTPR
jgi:hypothetical protein